MWQRSLDLVLQAGERGSDIVCLPEFCATEFGRGDSAAEPVPGPMTDRFAELAVKYGMYVLVPLVEAGDDGKQYNCVAVLDRSGKYVGCYRKTHLAPGEADPPDNISPGDEIPIFQADFGKFGITTCMDIHYPELYITLALKGAEIIFFPTLCMDYTGDVIESLVNARAFDNQVFMVPSHCIEQPYLAGKHYGRSRIVDCTGRIRADTGHFPGVAIAEIDLDQTYPMWYQGKLLERYPSMRHTLFKTRRPELYGELTKPVDESHWNRNEKKGDAE